MAQQLIDIGNAPNDKTGDSLREGGQKINENFTELYNTAGFDPNLSEVTAEGGATHLLKDWMALLEDAITDIATNADDIADQQDTLDEHQNVIDNIINGLIMTQAEYDALPTKDPAIMYVLSDSS